MNPLTRRSLLKSSAMPLAGMLGLPSLSQAAQAALGSYRRPKLKITEIRTAEVRVHGYQVHVRVYTDAGLVGQGESTDAAQGNVPLIRSFARLLVGQDPHLHRRGIYDLHKRHTRPHLVALLHLAHGALFPDRVQHHNSIERRVDLHQVGIGLRMQHGLLCAVALNLQNANRRLCRLRGRG